MCAEDGDQPGNAGTAEFFKLGELGRKVFGFGTGAIKQEGLDQ